jgi:hypothetical protein
LPVRIAVGPSITTTWQVFLSYNFMTRPNEMGLILVYRMLFSGQGAEPSRPASHPFLRSGSMETSSLNT